MKICSIPNYKMWNHSISMHTGRYWHQIFWNWGHFPHLLMYQEFLQNELHFKGIELNIFSSLRCIKSWILIYNRELKFPHRAVVLLPLDWCCMYQFKWPQMIENRICENTYRLKAALSTGIKSLQVMAATARGVCCGSNEAVTLLYLVPCTNTQTYRVI